MTAKSRRGTEKRQRTRQVPVRLTPGEHAKIVAAAAACGMTKASYMRAASLLRAARVTERAS